MGIVIYKIARYILACVFLMLINVGIQIVFKKRLFANWFYVNDLTRQQIEDKSDIYPPLDGWLTTFITCLIPIFNLGYLFFIIAVVFASEGFLFQLREIIRDLKRDGRWKS